MLRLVELLVSKGIGILPVLKIIAHLMPSFLVLTLPIACLIASITTFSQLSYDKELVAIRSAGWSLLRISRPVVFFSCLVFVLTLFLSQWGQPWSNISLKKLALSLIQNQLTLALETGVFNEPMPGLMVYVPGPADGEKPRGIFISDQRNPENPFIITAETFHILKDPQHNKLGIRLLKGTIHQTPNDVDQHHQVTFSVYDLKIDLSRTLNISSPQRPSYEEIHRKLNQTGWKDTGALRRLMEYYKDLGFPVAVLLLGVLGLPVGMVSKRPGRIGGFAIGILIMVSYYLLNVLGEFFVTTLVLHPFAGAWLPNGILLATTIILFYRVSRY